jgi:uncharacterized protein (TIGR03083 family)
MHTENSMMATPDADRHPSAPLTHGEAMGLAATEFVRMLDALRGLEAADWERSTVCDGWDVRALAGHVLGMAEAQASVRQFIHDYRIAQRRTDGPMIDAMTATQVRERASLTSAEIIEQLDAVAPRAVRARRRTPRVVRWAVRMRQDPPFDERWRFGYLVDTIFTRDTWMHRLDISRATTRPMELTADHDGRLVADVVGDWARRHGQPFALTLTGPAGGSWSAERPGLNEPAEPAEPIELDALEFCWIVGSRRAGDGLLATPVPF